MRLDGGGRRRCSGWIGGRRGRVGGRVGGRGRGRAIDRDRGKDEGSAPGSTGVGLLHLLLELAVLGEQGLKVGLLHVDQLMQLLLVSRLPPRQLLLRLHECLYPELLLLLPPGLLRPPVLQPPREHALLAHWVSRVVQAAAQQRLLGVRRAGSEGGGYSATGPATPKFRPGSRLCFQSGSCSLRASHAAAEVPSQMAPMADSMPGRRHSSRPREEGLPGEFGAAHHRDEVPVGPRGCSRLLSRLFAELAFSRRNLVPAGGRRRLWGRPSCPVGRNHLPATDRARATSARRVAEHPGGSARRLSLRAHHAGRR